MQRLRAVCVAVVAATVLIVLSKAAPAVFRDAVDSSTPGGSLDALCGAVAMVLAWALSAWLAVGVLLAVGAALPGVVGDRLRRSATRVAPGSIRRAVALAVGLAVVAPVANAHAAAPRPEPRYPVLDRVVMQPAPAAPVDPITSVAPALPVAPSAQASSPNAGAETAAAVTVQPGDSLWRITAAWLGPHASAAEIADAWPRWYAANRETIGADPGLIRPGQLLHPPVPAGAAATPPTEAPAP